MDGKADGVKWIHLFEAVTSEAVLIRSHQFTAYCNKIRNVTRNKNHHTDSFNPSLWKILNWIKESKFLSLKLRITLLWYQIHLQMCIFAISLLSLLLLFIPFQIGFMDYTLVIIIRLILYIFQNCYLLMVIPILCIFEFILFLRLIMSWRKSQAWISQHFPVI